MVAGYPPFWADDPGAVGEQVAFHQPTFPPFLTHSVISLLKGILDKRPQKRMTIPTILEHPWLSRSGLVRPMVTKYEACSEGIDWEIVDGLGIPRADFEKSIAEPKSGVEYKLVKRKSQMEAISAKTQRVFTPQTISVKYAAKWSQSNENDRPAANCLTPRKVRIG
jgi:serine/threonine protein kinase